MISLRGNGLIFARVGVFDPYPNCRSAFHALLCLHLPYEMTQHKGPCYMQTMLDFSAYTTLRNNCTFFVHYRECVILL